MISKAMRKLDPPANSILFIENVGNLVCPSLFDLGERHRIVIVSVTEGEDKPLKYPTMFKTSGVCIINKTDLLPYVDFNLETFKAYARKVNPHIEFLELSARSGLGMDTWYTWLKKQLAG
jgi:hydrogenase nickel incorporation protein HypB